MSTTSSAGAREPKRQRGHIRVAAIMEAGAEVFTERGYDAATMTEIAARSGTAIGSLYRFFPSKESLADALLLRYAQHALDGFAELGERAEHMTLDGLAGAFIDFKLALQSQRSLAIALVDARGGSDDIRLRFRKAMQGSVGSILRKAIPCLTQAKSEAMAVILLHSLKAVSRAAQEDPAPRRMLLAEIRELVRAYLVSAQCSHTE
jgi:AcrR family transcriptional regulator